MSAFFYSFHTPGQPELIPVIRGNTYCSHTGFSIPWLQIEPMPRSLLIALLLSTAITISAQTRNDSGITISAFNMAGDTVIAYVSRIMKQSPAATAGVKAGDIILSINDIPVKGRTATELNNATTGPAGSTVVLQLTRFGTAKQFAIKRSKAVANTKQVHTALLPALDSIRNIDVLSLYKYTDSCLVGDCSG